MNFDLTELEREHLGKLKAQLLLRLAEMRLAQIAAQSAQNSLIAEAERLIKERGWSATYDANYGEFGRFVEASASTGRFGDTVESDDPLLAGVGRR